MGRGNKDTEGMIGCMSYVLLGIFALPIIGLCWMCDKNNSQDKKILGGMMAVFGIVIWWIIWAEITG